MLTRALFLFAFLTNYLCANTIIQKVEFLKLDAPSQSIQEVKESKDFKAFALPLLKYDTASYIFRVHFNKEALEDKTYLIDFKTRFNEVELEESVPSVSIGQDKIILLNKSNFIPVLYVKIENSEKVITFEVEAKEYTQFLTQILTFEKLFGFSYGIVFTAFLYYLVFYFYNRKKSHIYYALTQASMLSILLFISTIGETPYDDLIKDTLLLCFFISSNLFTQHFLNTKTLTPRAHKVLQGLLVLFVLDFIIRNIFMGSFYSDVFPRTFPLLFYVFVGYLVYKQGNKHALFYVIGWSMVLLSFLSIEVQTFYPRYVLLRKLVYVLHLTTPIESIILAFALSYKMRKTELEKEEQRDFLIYQNKLASMGEMLANIAHQWRQPLTHLSYILMNIQTAFRFKKLEPEFLEKNITDGTKQLKYMSHTISDFQNFYKINKQKERFVVSEAIEEVLSLLRPSFESQNINIDVRAPEHICFTSYRGEFLQVLLNLVNNAKDALLTSAVTKPCINIDLQESEKELILSIRDNAAGIEPLLLEKIFEPYFTTKDKGLGLGLYMSKMIVVNNMQGSLHASNCKNGGAEFRLCFKKDKQSSA